MLRKTVCLLSVAVIFVLVLSCCTQKENTDYFDYQQNGFESDVTFEISGGKYSAHLLYSGTGNGKVTFAYPEELEGFVLEKDGENVYYYIGSLKLPLAFDKSGNTVNSLLSLFALTKDMISSEEKTNVNGVKVNILTLDTESGQIKAYLSSETGEPVKIEKTSGTPLITVNFTNFTRFQAAEETA